MADIKIVYDQKTGAFKGVELEEDGKKDPDFPIAMHGPGNRDLSKEDYQEFMGHIQKFAWRQHENIVLCHTPGNSVCTIIINGRPYKCC